MQMKQNHWTNSDNFKFGSPADPDDDILDNFKISPPESIDPDDLDLDT